MNERKKMNLSIFTKILFVVEKKLSYLIYSFKIPLYVVVSIVIANLYKL